MHYSSVSPHNHPHAAHKKTLSDQHICMPLISTTVTSNGKKKKVYAYEGEKKINSEQNQYEHNKSSLMF